MKEAIEKVCRSTKTTTENFIDEDAENVDEVEDIIASVSDGGHEEVGAVDDDCPSTLEGRSDGCLTLEECQLGHLEARLR